MHPMKGKCSEPRDVGRSRYKANGGAVSRATRHMSNMMNADNLFRSVGQAPMVQADNMNQAQAISDAVPRRKD